MARKRRPAPGQVHRSTFLCILSSRAPSLKPRLRTNRHPGIDRHLPLSIRRSQAPHILEDSEFTLPSGLHEARLRLGALVFVILIAFITLLLAFRFQAASDERAFRRHLCFTAILRGLRDQLTVVDTATYWSVFGQTVIAMGIFIGGLGVVTLATILSYTIFSAARADTANAGNSQRRNQRYGAADRRSAEKRLSGTDRSDFAHNCPSFPASSPLAMRPYGNRSSMRLSRQSRC